MNLRFGIYDEQLKALIDDKRPYAKSQIIKKFYVWRKWTKSFKNNLVSLKP